MFANIVSRFAAFAVLIVALLGVSACVSAPPSEQTVKVDKPKSGKLRIGFSMDTLKEERWQRDRDLFVKRAEELDAEVLVQSADGNDATQVRQAESLLTQGVDVLVVIPHNGEIAGAIVDAAKRENVPVISYDRLIRNSEPDLYISFDNEKVGEMQAKYLLERAPRGNYIMICGSPTDNNAKLFRQGQMNILQPAVERGDIKIVAEAWSKDWLADEALRNTENALTQFNNDVKAIVASNDATAGGAIQALQTQNLTGKVLVSGQDADLGGLQRIVAGTQAMTVYKPISKLAPRAAEAAVALAKREQIQTFRTINNGRIDVPSILLEPVVVDEKNLDQTVIKDDYQKSADIYKHAPMGKKL